MAKKKANKKVTKKVTKKATKKQAPKKTRTKIQKKERDRRTTGGFVKGAALGEGFHGPMGITGEGRLRHNDSPSAAGARQKDIGKYWGRARNMGIELGQAVSSAGSTRPLTRLEQEGPLLDLGPSKKKTKKKTKKKVRRSKMGVPRRRRV